MTNGSTEAGFSIIAMMESVLLKLNIHRGEVLRKLVQELSRLLPFVPPLVLPTVQWGLH